MSSTKNRKEKPKSEVKKRTNPKAVTSGPFPLRRLEPATRDSSSIVRDSYIWDYVRLARHRLKTLLLRVEHRQHLVWQGLPHRGKATGFHLHR